MPDEMLMMMTARHPNGPGNRISIPSSRGELVSTASYSLCSLSLCDAGEWIGNVVQLNVHPGKGTPLLPSSATSQRDTRAASKFMFTFKACQTGDRSRERKTAKGGARRRKAGKACRQASKMQQSAQGRTGKT